MRGRVDAILVGIGTALADDPLLIARPEGPRRALRVVLDSSARLPLTSQLVGTARQWPLVVATGPSADPARVAALEAAGAEVWRAEAGDHSEQLTRLLGELGRRRHTNILVEGGAGVFDAFFRADLADEIWAFTSPKVYGPSVGDTCGSHAPLARLPETPPMDVEAVSHPGGDLFVRGLVRKRRDSVG